jgi:hypothetical protein
MTDPVPVPDGPPANTTAMLCGPWAQPSDIPETYRALLSDNQWRVLIMYASEVLYLLSGSRWLGVGCEATATFVSRPAAIGTGTWPFESDYSCGCWSSGILAGETWYGWGYLVGYAGPHPAPVALKLDGSATAITAVTEGVTTLDPALYRLSRSGWIERTDGLNWSLCGGRGPTVVSYSRGVAPPLGGVMSVIQFAIELYKQWAGDKSCAIPIRATQVTRQGISITIDPTAWLDKRRTGIPPIDGWLAAVNPKGRTRGGSVWSPDIPTGTRG